MNPSVRADVLVQPEDVLRVIAALERLQALVLLLPVGLPDPLLTLLHEEVDVDGRVPGLERRPEVAHPLALLVEARGRLGHRGDVEGVACAAAVEGAVVVGTAGALATPFPDSERRS